MHVLIAYDISDDKMRNQFFKYLREKGLHSQKSVFECDMSLEDIKKVQYFADDLHLQAQDSVVLYPICKRCSSSVSILGQGTLFMNYESIIV